MPGRRRCGITVVLFAIVMCCQCPPSAAIQNADRWHWPLAPVPHVVRAFQAPVGPYGAGHRGVDLAGTFGQPVLAIGAGTVTFAGSVAGRGVVVIDHGSLRSTYEPVTASVHTGDRVIAGQPIATLQSVQSHCAPATCLHLGVRRGETYIDPLQLFGSLPVRLKPLTGLLPVPTGTTRRPPAVSTGRPPALSSSPLPAVLNLGAPGPAVTAAGLVTLAMLRLHSRRRSASGG